MYYSNAILTLVVTPLLSAPLIYLIGRLFMRTGRAGAASNASQLASLLALAGTWKAYIDIVLQFNRSSATALRYITGSVPLQVDGLSILLAGLALTLGTLVVIYSRMYMRNEDGEEKYYAMLVAMTGAMIGLACAADLFNLWVWFEVMALTSYLLVAFYREQKASLEAGVKYLVQSAAGSSLVLLAIALVFMETGTLDLYRIGASAVGTPLMLAAGALFVAGFGVKAALVPFHTWLPDAHAQAPSGISAMLSGVVIEAGLVALLRAISALMAVTLSWGVLLMIFGALNMLVGNLIALKQTQVKRLLAFSSLSHVGYMVMGLGIALHAGTAAGATGGVFHLINHGLMKGLAFLAVGALLYALHIAKGSHNPLTISDLAGAAKRYPLATLALSIAVLGLGGLPPLAGFMSKWQILVAGVQANNRLIFYLVIFAALNSVLSLGYYAPIVNAVYRQKPSAAVLNGSSLPLSMQVPMVLLLLAVVVLGLWPGLVQWLTDPAGNAIMATFGGY
ncbi:MAG TPA: hypothetical protein GXX29_01390 [Firmicutes bacterium]|nr:hypothetical protein [Bacillota bacterium]